MPHYYHTTPLLSVANHFSQIALNKPGSFGSTTFAMFSAAVTRAIAFLGSPTKGTIAVVCSYSVNAFVVARDAKLVLRYYQSRTFF